MQWSAGTAHCGALRLTLLHSGTVLDLYVKIWYKKKKNSFEKKKNQTKPVHSEQHQNCKMSPFHNHERLVHRS